MNVAVVTEGRGEKYLYKRWIPFVNPNLTYVERFDQLNIDNFAVVTGAGYPRLFQVIENAIADVNSLGNIDRLVISIDSEEMSLQDKLIEIETFLRGKHCISPFFIIIQHFCIETWALGNKALCPVHTSHAQLSTFKNFFDVRISDPELLPSYPPLNLNRAQFAAKYLQTMLLSKHPYRGYNKSKPTSLTPRSYFDQVMIRHSTTHHISSFSYFLNAFIPSPPSLIPS